MWNFELFADQTAAISETARITYREVSEESARLEVCLPGRCLVFCFCSNRIGSLLGYAAFLANRIVPVMVPADMDKDLVAHLIGTYRPAFLWLPDRMLGQFKYRPVWGSHGYSLLETGYEPTELFDGLALLLTTSGSTGSPKLVRQSYANIRSNAEVIADYLGITADERPITTLPMNYTYGLSIINSHWLKGATLLLTDRAVVERDFWTFFRENHASSFGGVPYTYEMLHRLRFFRMVLPSLTTMTQAGGKLSHELHRAFAEYAQANGKRFFVMYGQTEATARMAYLPHEKSLEKCGSMGMAIPGGKFELIDADGDRISEPETTGELIYYGPNVTMGYAECRADLAKGDENHGRLATGDMAWRDRDGYYYIVGRQKRFLKIFGNRVNLDETECLLKSIIPECACTGTDDHMIVFITEADRVQEVHQFIAGKTRINSAAFEVKVIAEIPKSQAGKTAYAKLNG